jgi:quinol monooxygenase YgiN
VSDPKVLLIAEIHGRTGLAQPLRTVLSELVGGTLSEPECVSYRVLTADEPAEHLLLGAWASEAALQAHYETPHYRRYREEVASLLSRPSDVVVHHLSSTVHARDPNPPDPGLLG